MAAPASNTRHRAVRKIMCAPKKRSILSDRKPEQAKGDDIAPPGHDLHALTRHRLNFSIAYSLDRHDVAFTAVRMPAHRGIPSGPDQHPPRRHRRTASLNDGARRLVAESLKGPDVEGNACGVAAHGGIPCIVDLDPPGRQRSGANVLRLQQRSQYQSRPGPLGFSLHGLGLNGFFLLGLDFATQGYGWGLIRGRSAE